jgi:hypothetical protein
MKLIKVNKTMSDYLKVFPDRYIKLQSGKIKIYSNQTTHQTLSKYNTEIDIFDNKKQMKEWVQGYIKKQKINLSRLKRLRLANDKRLKKNETN